MRHILHVSHMIHVIHIIHRIHAYIIYFSRMHESVRACVFILVILVTPLLRDTCCWRSCSGCITVVSTTLLHVTPYHESTVYNNNNITNNLSSNSNIVIIMLTSRFFSMGWQYNNSSDGPIHERLFGTKCDHKSPGQQFFSRHPIFAYTISFYFSRKEPDFFLARASRAKCSPNSTNQKWNRFNSRTLIKHLQ